MKIKDIMTKDAHVIDIGEDVRAAARIMRDADIGSLPVRSGQKLVGMLTDRDIVTRAVADGKTDGTVDRFMSAEVKSCYDDEDADAVALTMANLQVRRLLVLDRKERLVGMVSLSNLTRTPDGEAKREFLASVASPH